MIDPRRICGSGFTVATNSTAPSPCPLAPDLMVSHAPSAEADHAHSRAAVTAIDAVPPSAGSGASTGCIAIPQRTICVGAVMLVAADPPHEDVASSRLAAAAAVAIRLRRLRLRIGAVRICQVAPVTGACRRAATQD